MLDLTDAELMDFSDELLSEISSISEGSLDGEESESGMSVTPLSTRFDDLRHTEERVAKLLEYGHDIEEASGETHHMLPVPATFIIGRDGIIQFQYANPNYKVRLTPEVLLAAAQAALEAT